MAVLVAVLLLSGHAKAALAQDFSLDVRRIAMGGARDREHLAIKLVLPDPNRRAIVIPVGLAQILRHRHVFNPRSERFDPVAAAEYASSPIHYTFYDVRDSRPSGGTTLGSGSVYGLVAPNWGWHGLFDRFGYGHHVYVGAGPYLAASAEEATKTVDNLTLAQARLALQTAVAVSVGYTLYVPRSVNTYDVISDDGVYVAFRYHHIEGIRLDTVSATLQFETDAAGQPVLDARTIVEASAGHAWRGRGRSLDVGSALVAGGWRFAVTVAGLTNHIDWNTNTRLELPRRYTASAVFQLGFWSAIGHYGREFSGHEGSVGVERRLGAIEVRGGMRFVRGGWHPAIGVGMSAGRRGRGFDLAFYRAGPTFTGRRPFALAIAYRVIR